jgi:hypothetical protein
MQYNIQSLNPVLFKNSVDPLPMIYIKPHDALSLEFVEKKKVFYVSMNNTGTIYDNKKFRGLITKSSLVPNYRPNFYDQTKYYSIVVFAPWYTYPKENNKGTVTITYIEDDDKRNIEDVDKSIKDQEIKIDDIQIKNDVEEIQPKMFNNRIEYVPRTINGIGLPETVAILIIFMIIIFVLYIIFHTRKT